MSKLERIRGIRRKSGQGAKHFLTNGRLHRLLECLGTDGQGPVRGGFEGVTPGTAILEQPKGFRPVGSLARVKNRTDQTRGGGLFPINPK